MRRCCLVNTARRLRLSIHDLEAAREACPWRAYAPGHGSGSPEPWKVRTRFRYADGGPKNLFFIGAGGGGAAVEPIWSVRDRGAMGTWGLLDEDLELKLMCSVTPVVCPHLSCVSEVHVNVSTATCHLPLYLSAADRRSACCSIHCSTSTPALAASRSRARP